METLEYLTEILDTLDKKAFQRLKKSLNQWEWREERMTKTLSILNLVYENRRKPTEEILDLLYQELKTSKYATIKNNINRLFIKEVEDFILIRQLRNSPEQRIDTLIDYGLKSSKTLIVVKNERKLSYSIRNMPQGIWQFFYNFKLAHRHYFNALYDKADKKSVETFQKIIDTHHEFIAISELQLACELESRKRVTGSQVNMPFLTEVVKEIETGVFNNTSILTYSSILNLLKGNIEIEPENIIAFYEKACKIISFNERLDLLSFFINTIHTQINTTSKLICKEVAHDLHKKRLENDLIQMFPVLSVDFFIAAVQIASFLSIKKEKESEDDDDAIDWASYFIKKYQQYLPEDKQSETVIQSNAIVAFQVKNWSVASDLFAEISKNTKEVKMRIRAFTYQAMAMVEDQIVPNKDKSTWYVDDIKLVCKKLKNQLKHLENSQEAMPMYVNFADYLRKIVTKKNVDYNKIRTELNEETYLAAKNWLNTVIDRINHEEL